MKRLIIFLTLICLAGGFVYFKTGDKRYSCETVVDLSNLAIPRDSTGRLLVTRSYLVPDYTQIIPSDKAISHAIEVYDLESLLGIKNSELKTMISDNLEVTQLEGENTILIKTFAKTEERAEQLNYAIVKSYQAVRLEGLKNRRLESLREYQLKMKIQEDKVHDLKTRLDALSKKLGISYTISPSRTAVIAGSEVTGEPFKEEDHILLAVGQTAFSKVSEDYEREAAILDAIEKAMQSELGTKNNHVKENFRIYETGWSKATETMMKARKVLDNIEERHCESIFTGTREEAIELAKKLNIPYQKVEEGEGGEEE